jgi:hypothetical protein
MQVEPVSTADAHGHHEPPRSDLKDAIGWVVLGIAVLVGSLRMDRLQSQGINPYTIPGLLPALLGGGMILLGAVLLLRSWRRGAFAQALPPASEHRREQRKRIGVVLGLVLTYGLVLVGHPSLVVRLIVPGTLAGLPFWLASTVFVATTILVLQRMSRDAQEREVSARSVLKALVIGLAAAVVIQLVFQELFLVRLP